VLNIWNIEKESREELIGRWAYGNWEGWIYFIYSY